MRSALSLFVALFITAGPLAAQTYDVLIKGGSVVDGSGGDRYAADIAIQGDRIVAISREGIAPSTAARVIDATGRVVTPGFIDNHSHTQLSIADYPLSENFLRQGITTLSASLHSGDQPWPLSDFASELEMAPNMAFWAGHSWVRKEVMGLDNRAPTPAELDEMRALVDQSMRQGALGLSTGLLYVPANYAETEEII
jgi:N-acyl-D-amino-acid deacylase